MLKQETFALIRWSKGSTEVIEEILEVSALEQIWEKAFEHQRQKFMLQRLQNDIKIKEIIIKVIFFCHSILWWLLANNVSVTANTAKVHLPQGCPLSLVFTIRKIFGEEGKEREYENESIKNTL